MGVSVGNMNNIRVIWFDEAINNEENQKFFKQLKSEFKYINGFQSLDEGFKHFYKSIIENENEFKIIFVIVSGRLFGEYIKKFKNNINKIINIPYTYIFTSDSYKKLLLNQKEDEYHILSYDTMITVNDGFYNPGGVYDDFDKLFNDLKKNMKKIKLDIKIKPRIKDKINYEGVLTFEYLEREEDLLAPPLYKEIITNEEITEEHCKNFHKHILSFNDGELNKLIKYLDFFKYVPFEILSKYWARFYTIESDFYKILNNNLMKSKLSFNYKTFIKVLYKGVEVSSLKSYEGKFLYRGSIINKNELEKIKKFNNDGKLSNIVVFSKAFLSFSENENEALKFCGNSDKTKIGCLYILENNNINLHESNANIQHFSKFPNEKEILFFPGSSFIIKSIKKINNNKIEITLNYNGKFKEKYSFIYEDTIKINNLIYNNALTKIISGQKLEFLRGGKYLKGNLIAEGSFGKVFKGKDLETDEIVAIKQIEKIKNSMEDMQYYFLNEVSLLKKISEKIKYSSKYKDHFETKDYYYIIQNFYDDNLNNYLLKKKRLPPNLINKIFKQLNFTFKELLDNNIVHRYINPSNILIKYSNEEKTNFNSILSDYTYSKELDNSFDLMLSFAGTVVCMAPEILYGNKYSNGCDLYCIGATIYCLYFGKYPFNENILISLDRKKFDVNVKILEDKNLEDLINRLLKKNDKERITWEEYFEHPFFKQYEY